MSRASKFPELEGAAKDRAIREFLLWWIASKRSPRPHLLLADWCERRATDPELQRKTRCRDNGKSDPHHD